MMNTMRCCTVFALFPIAFAMPARSHVAERQQLIDETNDRAHGQWTAGLNPRFAGRPLAEVRNLLGVKATSRKAVLSQAAVFVKTPGLVLPEAFDAAENWPQCAKVITDIRDQSMCGCCWAFGAAEAASDRLCIGTNGSIVLPLSAEDMCFCASSDGCDGGDLFTPWSYLQTHGLVTGGQFNGTGPLGSGFCADFSLPHCHHHGPQGNDPYPAEGTPGCEQQKSAQCPSECDASAAAPHSSFATDKYGFSGALVSTFKDPASIQESIMTDGPVEAAFTVYGDFANYVSGVYKHVSGGVEGGHAIRIVGWGVDGGVKYWKVANSWNPYWGEQGYFRIERGTNECGIENQVTATGAGAKWGKQS